jgi:tRNA threonylcarbamoyladenosine biosynthesis protein TsaE
MQKFLENTEATEQFGGELFYALPSKCLVFLHGELGAGKTTLVRGYLRAAGHTGTVKSPTYNLVEEYTINEKKIYHFDLFRLNDPEELEWIGINDYLNQDCVFFIEWPDQGKGFLPEPDRVITLSRQGDGREISVTDPT